MIEKRFALEYDSNCYKCIADNEQKKLYSSRESICDLLNEQQAIITELEKNFEDLVGWSSEIAERNLLLDEEVGRLKQENRRLKEENKCFIRQLENFPPKIREIWLGD